MEVDKATILSPIEEAVAENRAVDSLLTRSVLSLLLTGQELSDGDPEELKILEKELHRFGNSSEDHIARRVGYHGPLSEIQHAVCLAIHRQAAFEANLLKTEIAQDEPVDLISFLLTDTNL